MLVMVLLSFPIGLWVLMANAGDGGKEEFVIACVLMGLNSFCVGLRLSCHFEPTYQDTTARIRCGKRRLAVCGLRDSTASFRRRSCA